MPTVELQNVSVGGAGARRLSGVDVAFTPGVTALLGPNGAGKSTLFGAVIGAVARAEGTVLLDGAPVRGRALASTGLGLVPQRAALPPTLTVGSVVRYAAWLQRVPAAQRDAAAAKVLELTNLAARADITVGRLSGGQQQRVALACALVHDPAVLLLDEPTVGLDPAERVAFYQALRAGLRAEATVVMATHLLEDVEAVADRVAVLVEGEVRFSGTVDAFAASGPAGEPLRAAYLAVVGREPQAA